MSTLRRATVLVLSLTLFFALASLTAAQASVMVQVTEHPELGTILTDGEGRTLYAFADDDAGESACLASCAALWPPLTVADESALEAGDALTGELATIERPDGTMQVTYNGMPLYYYAPDEQPGDALGQGVNEKWYVIPPEATTFEEAHEMSEAQAEAMEAMAPEAEATPAAEAAAEGEAPAEAAESAPQQMPTTGASDAAPTWTLLLAGALLLVAGLALARRPRLR